MQRRPPRLDLDDGAAELYRETGQHEHNLVQRENDLKAYVASGDNNPRIMADLRNRLRETQEGIARGAQR